LKENVYMVSPLALTSIQQGQICKLKKALYDLKQANREWFAKQSSFLLSVGYTQSMNNHSLFINSSFSLQQLSQFLVKPTIAHFSAAILRYIRGALSLGLFFFSLLKDQSKESKNNSNNNYESSIEVPIEFCSHIDQNLNEDHDTKQNFELDQLVRMSTRIKKPPEYLKDYHSNINVSNTSSRVKYPLDSVLSYNNLSPIEMNKREKGSQRI